mgnify:CR=1 FL=1
MAVERLGTELTSPVAGSAVDVDDTPEEARQLTSADFIVSASYDHPTLCPGGHASIEETESKENPNRIEATFDQKTCEACHSVSSLSSQAQPRTGWLRIIR